jgi:hypothetical protein
LPSAVQSFVDRAGNLGVVLEAAPKSLQIRWRGPGDQSFALAGINEHGELRTPNVSSGADAIGHVELAHEYLEKIATLIGGEVRKTPHPTQWYVTQKGTKQYPSVTELLKRQDEWLTLIGEYTEKLRAALVDAGSV